MTWWDAIQPEAMNCQSMQKFDSTGYVRLIWESIGKATEFSYASVFEVKMGQKPERAFADLREKTVDTLLSDLGTVALVIEGSDLSMTEDNSVPTANCWRCHGGSIQVLQEARVPSSVQLFHCRHVKRTFNENSK